MMWLNLRTEFSFGAVYGPVELVASTAYLNSKEKLKWAGIADINGTWGHVRWSKACKKYDIKPIFGVRLTVTNDLASKDRRGYRNEMTFIALNYEGLKSIYGLVDIAHQNFYYEPRISYQHVNALKESDVVVLSGVAVRSECVSRSIYCEMAPNQPLFSREKISNIYDPVACTDNWYPTSADKSVYEPFADDRKLERRTTPMHILTDKEWLKIFPRWKEAIKLRNKIAKNANVSLPVAKLVKYQEKFDIKELCKKGAIKKGISLKKKAYKNRLKRELSLIKLKGYEDYFMVVSDLISYAKSKMLVGPSRGSSAGSLVCYLMGITEIDPIPYGLVFERFIDINRDDLPDIDIDFQDNKRDLVMKYVQKKYGISNVAQIGNVNRLKPKSALTRFAKSLSIPAWEADNVKDAIVERSSGDARANLRMEDNFTESDIGKEFIKSYPNMAAVTNVENHASHTGIHAAGILVCNEEVTNFCGVNSRNKNKNIAMIDKKDAEHLGLLKIDALGLRTLTILAEVCDAINKPYEWLYTIPLDDAETYKVFKDQRLTGIFQFEGNAVRGLAKQMPVENIDDISALGALGRPGPLATGGASSFVSRRSGTEKVTYMSNHPDVVNQISETFGVIIYQEQVMTIGREYGGLSWGDVCELRKAMSKSKGDEFFDRYKKKFVQGAVDKGASQEEAGAVWKNMNSMGSWSFNKSHAVSYGVITYLCAYLKAHHPLEFAVATLNNAKNDSSALKLLRDLKEHEGIEHIPFDIKLSQKGWSVHQGKLYGGLLTLSGVGIVTANKVLAARIDSRLRLTPGILNKIRSAATPFQYLYPGKELYGGYYDAPDDHGVKGMPVDVIADLKEGECCFIGCLTKKVVRDSNEAILISRRGYVMDGQTTYLNATFEDDTENVMCTIGRHEYEMIGREVAEKGSIDKDWYLIYGTYDPDWHKVYVINIKNITKKGGVLVD